MASSWLFYTHLVGEAMATGVVVIITSSDGVVQGVGSDFNPSKPGGFALREAQEHRAKERAWAEAIRGHCSGALGKAFTSYIIDQLSGELRHKCGWTEVSKDVET